MGLSEVLEVAVSRRDRPNPKPPLFSYHEHQHSSKRQIGILQRSCCLSSSPAVVSPRVDPTSKSIGQTGFHSSHHGCLVVPDPEIELRRDFRIPFLRRPPVAQQGPFWRAARRIIPVRGHTRSCTPQSGQFNPRRTPLLSCVGGLTSPAGTPQVKVLASQPLPALRPTASHGPSCGNLPLPPPSNLESKSPPYLHIPPLPRPIITYKRPPPQSWRPPR